MLLTKSHIPGYARLDTSMGSVLLSDTELSLLTDPGFIDAIRVMRSMVSDSVQSHCDRASERALRIIEQCPKTERSR